MFSVKFESFLDEAKNAVSFFGFCRYMSVKMLCRYML